MGIMELFPTVLNMSVTGAVAVGFVMLARVGLKKAPKVFSYALWSVVLFRLLCPVSLTVDFSVFRLADAPAVEVGEGTTAMEFITGELVYPGDALKEIPGELEASAEKERASVLPGLWLAGVGMMGLWSLGSLLRLKRKIREAAPIGGNVWECDALDTAFVMGLARPRIWLPSGLTEEERKFILLHEEHHIRRLDHLWKLAAFGALCVHWFNPLVWLAFYLAEQDMEMSCDEAVLGALGTESRCDYSQTLLRFCSGRRWTLAMPLAFGEGNVKERVVNVLKWKKPRLWVSIVCGIVCMALLAACGGNPAVEITEPEKPVETAGPDLTQMRETLDDIKSEVEERQEEYERLREQQNTYTVDVELAEYANIRLELPQGWIYETVEPELETSAQGIRFWPAEYPAVCIELCWHPSGFGVCGTGLMTTEMELDCGRTAELGFYDGSDTLSYCAYGMDYAAVNVSTVDKWEEYGDTILTILKSVELNRGVISEEEALEAIQAEGLVQQGWKHYRSKFDVTEGVWTFRFYEDDYNDAVHEICVDHQGSCWHRGEISRGEHHSGHHHDW